jgi:hypothetical protein
MKWYIINIRLSQVGLWPARCSLVTPTIFCTVPCETGVPVLRKSKVLSLPHDKDVRNHYFWKELSFLSLQTTYSKSGGMLEYFHCRPASHRRRWKRNSVPRIRARQHHHWGDINIGTWSSRLELDARLMTLLCKNYCCEIQMETRCYLSEFSKKDYSSKRTVLLMMTTTNYPMLSTMLLKHI